MELPPGWNIDELKARVSKRLPTPEDVIKARYDYVRLTVRKSSQPPGYRDKVTIFYHMTPESWLRALVTAAAVKLPLWRVITPWGSDGAVYYVFYDEEDRVHVFRGTYGYGGCGPHQSALIEAFIDRYLGGLYFENRDGDYLLGLLKLT